MNKHVNKHKTIKPRADYGDTPVGVENLAARQAPSRPPSVLDRIKSAPSMEVLRDVVSDSAGYVFASDKTRRRWDRAFLDRRAFLKGDEA